MIVEDDDHVKEHLTTVENKCLDRNLELQEQIWGIQDTQDVWDTSIDNINQKLLEKAEELGISK